MKSKISFFNTHIFISNLKRLWPLWTVVSVGGMVVPFGLLISRFGGRMDHYDTADLFVGILTDGCPVIAFIYAVVAAMCVWGYLYNHRSVSAYHSMPVTRRELYITNYASGLAVMLIPLVLCGLVTMLLSSVLGIGATKFALISGLLAICEFILFFSIATFAAHVTGNMVALLVSYVAINIFAPLIESVTQNIVNNFVYGLYYEYEGHLKFLAPLFQLYSSISAERVEMNEERSVVCGVTNVHVILIYAALAVLLSVVTYILYSRRKSERAGYLAAFDWIKKVFHFLYTLGFAIVVSSAVYEILRLGSVYDIIYNPVLFTFCEIASITIGYYTGHMIIEGTARVFSKKRVPGLVIWLLSSVAIIVLLTTDAFRLGEKTPNVNDVKEVYISMDGCDMVLSGEDKEIITALTEAQKKIYADRDRVRSRDSLTYSDNVTYDYIRIDYTLSNGRSLLREYRIPTIEEDYNDPSSAIMVCKEFLGRTDVTLAQFRIKDGYSINDCSVSSPYEYITYDVASENSYEEDVIRNINPLYETLYYEEGMALFKALKKDAMEGSITAFDNCRSYYSGECARAEFYFLADELSENGRYYESQMVYLKIDKNCTNAISVLRKYGYDAMANAIENSNELISK